MTLVDVNSPVKLNNGVEIPCVGYGTSGQNRLQQPLRSRLPCKQVIAILIQLHCIKTKQV